MSSIAIAAVLIACIVAISLLLAHISNKQKRRMMSNLLQQLRKFEVENNLSFSFEEVMDNLMLGLDDSVKLLAILKPGDAEAFETTLIKLADIKSCFIKKQYGRIDAGGLKVKQLEDHLEKLSLFISTFGEKEPVELVFYIKGARYLHECWELEQKARDWETIISSALPVVKHKRA